MRHSAPRGSPSSPRGFSSAEQAPAQAAAAHANVELTVDSIMRGPDLVGYPPTGLRWSADSQKLYFDWRKPGEDESLHLRRRPRRRHAAQAVRRGARRTSRRPTGRWDKARRRVLFVDGGDIVIYDAQTARAGRSPAPPAAKAIPRWARNDTHVTYVRDGNLFIVPVDRSGTLAHPADRRRPRRVEPRLTDSQKFIREKKRS